LKRMVFITDAMRQDELDSDGLIFVSYAYHSPPGMRHRERQANECRSNLTKTEIPSASTSGLVG
jgi:hypothetical protein